MGKISKNKFDWFQLYLLINFCQKCDKYRHNNTGCNALKLKQFDINISYLIDVIEIICNSGHTEYGHSWEYRDFDCLYGVKTRQNLMRVMTEIYGKNK